jgi:8-amino-7-oxononanoate synthase
MTSVRALPHAGPFDWLDNRAEFRRKIGLERTLRARGPESDVIDAAGNDYLGLSQHPAVCEAAISAVREWGVGATSSRLVAGTTYLHTELESALARFHGSEAALVFSSGYAANLGAVTALCGPDTLLIADRHNHASLVDAVRLTAGEVVIVQHNDVDEIRTVLQNNTRTRALVVTESIFSVDGEQAPLRRLADVCETYGAGLLIDDAHGFGVVGDGAAGLVADVGLAGRPDVVTTVTLSKALGAQGGAVLGPRRVIDHLINCARSFIFDTGLAPAAVAGAKAALQIVIDEPQRAERVRGAAAQMAQRFEEAGMSVQSPAAAIVSVRAPSAEAAATWAADCRSRGVAVGCFRPPSVPDRISRLRLTARADWTHAELARVVDTVIDTFVSER